ncbi:MAG: hypothetical protein WEB04_01955 [Dehalococcoidia bacterium]
MAVKSWTAEHGPNDKTDVVLHTQEGQVTKFAVQYLAFFEQWTPIVRYDTAHGEPHRDVMHPDGTHDTLSLRRYAFEAAFELALSDIDNNWLAYRERYERERNNA